MLTPVRAALQGLVNVKLYQLILGLKMVSGVRLELKELVRLCMVNERELCCAEGCEVRLKNPNTETYCKKHEKIQQR